MKFFRVEIDQTCVPCVLDPEQNARDISSVVGDISPDSMPGLLAALADVDLRGLPAVSTEGARLLAPMAQPRNIYCIGLNYSDHAAESGMPIPAQPIVFNKTSSAFCGPDDPAYYLPGMSKMDWEIELGIVIGKPGFNLSREAALDHVLGYVLVNDLSERVWQLELDGQWIKGKGFINACPTGPWLVTGDEIGDARELDMWLDVNGQRMQSGNTRTMIFDCAYLVSDMSRFFQLEPGDLICTGTPPGVGLGMKPPVYLKPGDVMHYGIEGLGEQNKTIVPYPES